MDNEEIGPEFRLGLSRTRTVSSMTTKTVPGASARMTSVGHGHTFKKCVSGACMPSPCTLRPPLGDAFNHGCGRLTGCPCLHHLEDSLPETRYACRGLLSRILAQRTPICAVHTWAADSGWTWLPIVDRAPLSCEVPSRLRRSAKCARRSSHWQRSQSTVCVALSSAIQQKLLKVGPALLGGGLGVGSGGAHSFGAGEWAPFLLRTVTSMQLGWRTAPPRLNPCFVTHSGGRAARATSVGVPVATNVVSFAKTSTH